MVLHRLAGSGDRLGLGAAVAQRVICLALPTPEALQPGDRKAHEASCSGREDVVEAVGACGSQQAGLAARPSSRSGDQQQWTTADAHPGLHGALKHLSRCRSLHGTHQASHLVATNFWQLGFQGWHPHDGHGSPIPGSPCPNSWLQHQQQQQQMRGYKSLKKSMKPLNSRASRLAVAPFLPSTPRSENEERQAAARQRLLAAPVIDTALPPVPTVPTPDELRRVGKITAAYVLDTQAAFAVVQLQGTQFKVTADDILFVNHLPHVAVNEVLALDQVLLLGGRTRTHIGRPHVPGAAVIVAVEEHFRDGEVHVFKFKKRNRYKKYNTERQALTTLRVLHIAEDGSSEALQAYFKDRLPVSMYVDATRSSGSDAGSEGDAEEVRA